jgi:hypothetical protein
VSGGIKHAQQYYQAQTPAPPAPITQPEIATEADKAAEEVKSKARKASGRSSTILTSPLGVVGAAPVATKTLLGS